MEQSQDYIVNKGIMMTQNVFIRLARDRIDPILPPPEERPPPFYTPGEVVCQGEFMRGHGTYMEDDQLKASVAGIMERVNKLILVQPIKTRYNGKIGDVVVGRIVEIKQKRWKVDTHSKLDSILHLKSVNLPGGELRRRSVEDEHMMRKYLREGDLISAEVQEVYSDGSLSLYTRSLKYGKLSQGVLVEVSPSLIKRRKTHFHNLACGASIILGTNGFIWISPIIDHEDGGSGGHSQNLAQVISKPIRTAISRLRNCILALANSKVNLFDTSIVTAYEMSLKYTVSELLNPEQMYEIAMLTRQQLTLMNQ